MVAVCLRILLFVGYFSCVVSLFVDRCFDLGFMIMFVFAVLCYL